ncbi:hypothetical protein [Mesorhizobium sp. WSM4884]|uniref:hypothetical protein n=1 Tax=Mesorhizobium sp. WSM4884 TaxID=3038542 RepID=UPI0024169AF8|nr:hypothetical protein [Mesorhizobium sp. WSM4884]MDG4882432.1 hypothetical protein [Mesorhizobium sp. WSM4884]
MKRVANFLVAFCLLLGPALAEEKTFDASSMEAFYKSMFEMHLSPVEQDALTRALGKLADAYPSIAVKMGAHGPEWNLLGVVKAFAAGRTFREVLAQAALLP